MPAKQMLQPSHCPLQERATSLCGQCCLKRDAEEEAKDSAVLWVTSCPEDSPSPSYRCDL